MRCEPYLVVGQGERYKSAEALSARVNLGRM